MTAEIMMAERIAFGVYLKMGVINSKVRNTTQDMTMLETAVLQPAMKFTAEREKEPARSNMLQSLDRLRLFLQLRGISKNLC